MCSRCYRVSREQTRFLRSLETRPLFCGDFLGEAKHRFRLELAEKYGKIFSVAVANVNLVFLNDFELVKEAFVTKGV